MPLMILDVVKNAPKVLALANRADKSQALQERFDASILQANADMSQVAYGIGKSMVAVALGRDPSSEEVDRFLEHSVQDPTFPARAYRLLGEARRSASRRRREFLVSMLLGLPFTTLPDDERDRVDMAFERMMPQDARLLLEIAQKQRIPRNGAVGPLNSGSVGCDVFALLQGIGLRLATSKDWGLRGSLNEEVREDERFLADRGALASLIALGCIDIGTAQATWGSTAPIQIHLILLTMLGGQVVGALEEVEMMLGSSRNRP